ncbi:MAG: calcium-binding protein [Myxococcales bacterium]|nr:calcium-binding protein [Myxococcales bacterium]
MLRSTVRTATVRTATVRTVACLLVIGLVPACDPDDEEDGLKIAMTEDEEPTGGEEESSAGSEESGEDSEGAEGSSGEAEPEEPEGESITPLVLAFAGEAVQFNTRVQAAFDLTGTMSVVTDWPTSTTPWLALDRNHNGRVDDGGELFGSATLLSTGRPAGNGFVALRELDSNWDGRIDAADAQWPLLLVWSDVDSDRVSAIDELQSVTARELVAIDLRYVVDKRCDARGNCEVERALFTYRSGGRELSGAVVDVHLQPR